MATNQEMKIPSDKLGFEYGKESSWSGYGFSSYNNFFKHIFWNKSIDVLGF